MKYPEDVLPYELQFETVASGISEEIDEVLAETLSEAGDIVNVSQEFSRDVHALWNFSGLLAVIMRSETENDVQVQAAMYRGMCFGLQIANELKSESIKELATSTVFEIGEAENLQAALLEGASQYLSKRPTLDILIQRQMPEIDPTHLSNHHAEVGAALFLLLCERQQGDIYIKNSFTGENLNGSHFSS